MKVLVLYDYPSAPEEGLRGHSHQKSDITCILKI